MTFLGGFADPSSSLASGLHNGYYTFTNDLITDIMRVGTGLTIPGNNVIWDSLLRIVAMVSNVIHDEPRVTH
jgi:hypothetical protein